MRLYNSRSLLVFFNSSYVISLSCINSSKVRRWQPGEITTVQTKILIFLYLLLLLAQTVASPTTARVTIRGVEFHYGPGTYLLLLHFCTCTLCCRRLRLVTWMTGCWWLESGDDCSRLRLVTWMAGCWWLESGGDFYSRSAKANEAVSTSQPRNQILSIAIMQRVTALRSGSSTLP